MANETWVRSRQRRESSFSTALVILGAVFLAIVVAVVLLNFNRPGADELSSLAGLGANDASVVPVQVNTSMDAKNSQAQIADSLSQINSNLDGLDQRLG